ncbi:MAG TPA: hypothetical protein VFJ85_03270 [Acidimicrobiales bacterium]|nr:hypothetical protein [Acidimicrobiales bacterium]
MTKGGSRGPGGGERWVRGTTALIGLVALGARVGVETGSWEAGIGAALAFAAVIALLAAAVFRRSSKRARALLASGPPKVEGVLDFACLPGPWPRLARETLPAVSGEAPGLTVTVAAADGVLRIDKVARRTSGRHPFTAEVSLAAVADVTPGKARHALLGSSLTFLLDEGKDVAIDTALDAGEAEELASRFREAAARAHDGPAPGPRMLEVTSSPPPPRTSPAASGLLLMATFPPFAIAMAGAPNGPAADTVTTLALFAALWLRMWRPPTMARTLGLWCLAAAAAFVVDAALSGEPLRLVGTAVSLLLGRWMYLKTPGGEA